MDYELLMNGNIKLNPDSKILSNLPKRSTITTSACLTIITPLIAIIIANITNTPKKNINISYITFSTYIIRLSFLTILTSVSMSKVSSFNERASQRSS